MLVVLQQVPASRRSLPPCTGPILRLLRAVPLMVEHIGLRRTSWPWRMGFPFPGTVCNICPQSLSRFQVLPLSGRRGCPSLPPTRQAIMRRQRLPHLVFLHLQLSEASPIGFQCISHLGGGIYSRRPSLGCLHR